MKHLKTQKKFKEEFEKLNYKEEKSKGLAAKARLKELVEGKFVRVQTEKDEQEKFGRYLAVVFLDDVNVNRQLITEGHAVEYFGGKR